MIKESTPSGQVDDLDRPSFGRILEAPSMLLCTITQPYLDPAKFVQTQQNVPAYIRRPLTATAMAHRLDAVSIPSPRMLARVSVEVPSNEPSEVR